MGISIVNPTSHEAAPRSVPRHTVPALDGLTVGFLCNSKTNADQVLEGVATALVERYGVTPRLYAKRVPSIAASDDVLDEIAADCAAVVVAMLDCGSCASWAVADMAALAGRGLPVCGVASTQFEGFSRQVLAIQGADALGLSVLAHPIGGIPPREAFDRVTPAAVDAVVAALTTEPGKEHAA
ncbi:hypothetical protein SRB5_00590 [Streptomyces sp. RB5]|uniref:UGSC-like domain-containing protein n=1 Tax=Streptomyces smaragdinus TaxID=2585196 RepID=A0A7K0C916_9ACTN|nr:hypothetical protein [Streptomyces smaragdinus]MQY09955.1 hypothetical protein [Streptomyces smaragdinus]